ncbi:MAG: M42 family peptidase [Clostridiales bacterium]|nr:M42 family peptidase [Clostridiales bacterium]
MRVELLKELCEIAAISGREDALIQYVVKYMKKYTDQVHVDKLGNVTATFDGADPDTSTIAFFAHMDEIGLIVRKVEENGFLRVERLGGVPERALVSLEVQVHSLDDLKSYPGIFGIISHHITPSDKKYEVMTTADLYIDIGATSRKEVLEMGIDIGSVVTYRNNFMLLRGMVVSKALDDRMGIYNLLEVTEYLKDHPHKATVHLIFSVQEEFNIRSCTPTFNRLKPDVAVCVDITPSCDTPDTYGRYEVKLGGGPAIMYMNFHGRGTLGGLLPNPKLNRFMEKIAEENKIAVQKEVIIGVITDDAFTQHVGEEGIPMGHLSIPLRYTHSPAEAANIKDIDATTNLLIKIVEGLTADTDFSRG